MTQEQRVLICDDHSIFRQGIRQVLAKNPDLEVVGEAATGLEAIAAVKKLKPDLVVMDITMPELSGIEVTKEITGLMPECKVVILSVHSRKTFIMEALKAGARGYVLKDSAGEKLLDAVQAVREGECYLDTPVAAHIVDEFVRMPGRDGEEELPEKLTRPGTADSAPGGGGLRQQGHRRETVHQPQDGGQPPGAHHGQAGPARRDRPGQVRHRHRPGGPGLLGAVRGAASGCQNMISPYKLGANDKF